MFFENFVDMIAISLYIWLFVVAEISMGYAHFI